MKYIPILLGLLVIGLSKSNAQEAQQQYVNVEIGTGSIAGVSLARTYSLNYGYHLKMGVYLQAGLTKGQASSSLFESIDLPPPTEAQQFGQVQGTNLNRELINITTWRLGLNKLIQLGDHFFMNGGVAIATTGVSRQSIGGIPIEINDITSLNDLYPVFEEYRKFGANVGLSAMYVLQDHLAISLGAQYLSSPASYHLQVGANSWF